MSKYDLIRELDKEIDRFALEFFDGYEAMAVRENLGLIEKAEKAVERFKQTGLLTIDFNNDDEDDKEERPQQKDATINVSSESSKENVPESKGKAVRASTRPKRSALKQLTSTNTTETSNNNVTMLESSTSNVLTKLKVKLERLSEETSTILNESKVNNVTIKKETDKMPPPLNLPIRQTRRRKATAQNLDIEARNIKVEQIEEQKKKRITNRDSDVQIQSQPIDMVNLVDSEDETEKSKTRGRQRTKMAPQNADQSCSGSNSDQDGGGTARTTRTKTRRAAKAAAAAVQDDDVAEKQKRLRSPSADEDSSKTRTTRTKSKRTRANRDNESVYEDAVDAIPNNSQPPLNQTVVLETRTTKQKVLNETVVVNKEMKVRPNVELKDIMTDDEDVVISPPKDNKKPRLKQVFSPYTNSPVKHRVQAFEKLQAEAGNHELPPRMTRTKTKAKAKAQEENSEGSSNEAAPPNSNTTTIKQGAVAKAKKGSIPVKTAQTTPISDHRLLLNATTEKYKQRGYGTNDSSSEHLTTSAAKPRSAIKSSQAEFRERELRRKQKEAEALSKKEALIQALTEERKRKREERQIKAQQTRDALEKDKQKTLESAERVKQEKLRQMLAEKEEKLTKQKEEAARKRALAQKKAAEEKQKEEQRRLEQMKASKKKSGKNGIPAYLKYETPMLPTEDCYDSDDSSAGKTINVPAWQRKEALIKVLRCMRYVEEQKRNLFCNGPTTVDLQEIFPSIEPHKLKRTSSAIWNRSGMLKLTSLTEEEGHSA